MPWGSRRRAPWPTGPSTVSRCRAPTPPRTSSSASAPPSASSAPASSSWRPPGTAGEDILAPKEEVDWMRRLSAAIQRPVTFAMVQVDAAPDLWRELMDESLAGRLRRRRPVAPGGRPRLRAAVRALHHLLPPRPDPGLPGAEGTGPARPTTWSPPSARPRCATPSSPGSPTRRPPSAWTRRTRPPSSWATRPSTSRDPSGHWPGSPRPPAGPPLVGRLRRHARGRRAGPAVRADPELLRRRPPCRPGDAAAPPGRGRPRRRRGALRGDLRRLPADVHAHPLDP